MTGEAHGDKGQTAFERAVARERVAIERHEAAAEQNEHIAARLEQLALDQADDLLRDQALEGAAHARERAELARGRAATARKRLRDEGVDPNE